MNVLIITQYFYPEVGATQNRMASFARALVQRGHSVTILTEFPNHPHGIISEPYRGRWIYRESWQGCQIIRVFVWASSQRTFHKRMRFYISFMMTAGLHGLKVKERPDLVLATTPPIFAAVAGRYLAALKGAKFILDVRDLWPAAAIVLGQLRSSSAAKWAQKLERYLYRNADLISTTTGGFQRRITATESIAPALVVPNGTEPGLFNPALLDSSLRERLGFNGKTVVGFAGNLGIAQDLNTVIETARLLRRTGRLFFFFIGAGPREQWCRDRVRELRLRNVLFHPQVPVDRIVPYILAMDVALVTLEANPLFSLFVPSKLYDYMACRRPVVTNVAGETERIIEESNGGVVVPGGNPAALAKAIENLAGDPERMARMGKSGREYVSHHYDRNVIADSFVSRMEELADSRS